VLVSCYSCFVLHLLKFSFLNLFFFHIPLMLFFTLSFLVPLFSRCSSNVVPHIVFFTLFFALFLLRYFSLGVNIFFALSLFPRYNSHAVLHVLHLLCLSFRVAPLALPLPRCSFHIATLTLLLSYYSFHIVVPALQFPCCPFQVAAHNIVCLTLHLFSHNYSSRIFLGTC
jgi:hypothetical protein